VAAYTARTNDCPALSGILFVSMSPTFQNSCDGKIGFPGWFVPIDKPFAVVRRNNSFLDKAIVNAVLGG